MWLVLSGLEIESLVGADFTFQITSIVKRLLSFPHIIFDRRIKCKQLFVDSRGGLFSFSRLEGSLRHSSSVLK